MMEQKKKEKSIILQVFPKVDKEGNPVLKIKEMDAYKVFIKKEDGTLKSIFHKFEFEEGKNIKEEDTEGFYSWGKEKEAERFKETLAENFFYTIVIRKVKIKEVETEKIRIYTKKDQKRLKVKKPYGTLIRSETVEII